MNNHLQNNINELLDAANAQTRNRHANKPGFKNQQKKIYIYKALDFYKNKRAIITDNDNTTFLWSIEKVKETTSYVLEKRKVERDTFFSVKAVGTNLEYSLIIDEELLTENETLLITFEALTDNLKLENVFKATLIEKTGAPSSIAYEYNLTALNTLTLGQNSRIKLLNNTPNIKTVKSITINNLNPYSHFMGFDSNINGTVKNVFPIWNKIIKSDNASIDYKNLWSNRKWLISWNELSELKNGDKVNFESLIKQNGITFTPLRFLLKKIIDINLSYINNFNGTTDEAVNQIGASPGKFWKDTIGGKSQQEVAAVLNSYIDAEIKLWKSGSFRTEIKPNFPFGEPQALPNNIIYNQRIVKKLYSILTMLGNQIISGQAFFYGRNEATKLLLPYFLTFDESKFFYNTTNNMIQSLPINELTIESNYFLLDYPIFTQSQITEYQNTGQVSTYKYDIQNDNLEVKYGPLNPYLLNEDKPIIITTINEVGDNLYISFSDSGVGSGAGDVYGWENNPLIAFITDLRVKDEWTLNELKRSNWVPTTTAYSYGTFNDGQAGSVINIRKSNNAIIRSLTFEDVLNHPNIGIGFIKDGTPNPTSDKFSEIDILGDLQQFEANNRISVNPLLTRIKEIDDDVKNNANKKYIGTPRVLLYIEGNQREIVYGPLSIWRYGIRAEIRASISESDLSILETVSKRKGITITQMEEEINLSQQPKLILNELKNEGLLINILEQDVQLGKPGEYLTEEDYITLPSGYDATSINQTWIYYPVKNELSETLDLINNEEVLTNFENNKITIYFNNQNEVLKLEQLFLYYLNSANSFIEVIYDDNKSFNFNTKLGDKSNSGSSLTNLVFSIQEEE